MIGSGLDLHCGAYVAVAFGRHGWVPEQQALPIRIIRVNDDAGNVCLGPGFGENSLDGLFKLPRERVLDVLATGLLNRVQSRLALFPAQCFQLRYGRLLPEVPPKDSDVDVLGKSRDQPVGFRQRSSTFEEKTRMASGESIEKHIERPSDPKILFDVLFRRAESSCRAEEHVTAIPWCCSEKL
jgi:hypothetical protein